MEKGRRITNIAPIFFSLLSFLYYPLEKLLKNIYSEEILRREKRSFAVEYIAGK